MSCFRPFFFIYFIIFVFFLKSSPLSSLTPFLSLILYCVRHPFASSNFIYLFYYYLLLLLLLLLLIFYLIFYFIYFLYIYFFLIYFLIIIIINFFIFLLFFFIFLGCRCFQFSNFHICFYTFDQSCSILKIDILII